MHALAFSMTYGGFHLRFNLPVLLLLLALNSRHAVAPGEVTAWGAVLAAVMVFTTPWDNAAARAGIWGFPRNKYWRSVGWLPVEEYLFFLWQSANVMLAGRWVLREFAGLRSGFALGWQDVPWAACGALFLGWILAGLWFWRHRPARRWHYAFHLFFWFGPVILLQWTLAGPLLMAHAGLLAGLTLGWGTYYIAADLVAVRHGVWHFDVSQTEGRQLGGILPWEEAAFFYLTSLLVAQSWLLLLPAGLR